VDAGAQGEAIDHAVPTIMFAVTLVKVERQMILDRGIAKSSLRL
jgi:hypothetical protein